MGLADVGADFGVVVSSRFVGMKERRESEGISSALAEEICMEGV